MTDDSPASEWPPHIAALYQEDTTQLRFMKRQQWAITNYLLALLAGIFGIDRAIGASNTIWDGTAPFLVWTATAIASALIFTIQCQMKQPRCRLAKTYSYWASRERKTFVGLTTTPTSWCRDLPFIIPLWLVCLTGAAIVGYAVTINDPRPISVSSDFLASAARF